MYGILHSTDLHTSQISRSSNLFGVVGQLTESILPESDCFDTRSLKLVQKALSDLTVKYFVCILCSLKQIRQIQCCPVISCGREIRDRTCGRQNHILSSHGNSIHHIRLAAKCRVRIDIQGHLAVRILFQLLLHLYQT